MIVTTSPMTRQEGGGGDGTVLSPDHPSQSRQEGGGGNGTVLSPDHPSQTVIMVTDRQHKVCNYVYSNVSHQPKISRISAIPLCLSV